MNVPDEQLDRWLRFAELVRQTTISVRLGFSAGKATQAREQLGQLHDAAIVTAQSMERTGARRTQTQSPPPEVPLRLLDTSANRRYLRLLEETHAAALDVDEERGYGREGAGPASGMVEMLLVEARQEVCGPAGARE
jgi:hypothetical protein